MNRSRSSVLVLSLFLLLQPFALRAHEGMWLPTLLKAIQGDLQTAGLQITAEDIYSINNSSIKDAVVLFGGGCTAEVVSTQGLILTNHHCGFSQIQQHSSMEHNYLRDGFNAVTLAEELPNPGLTATFIVRMEDVTDRMQAAFTPGMSEGERDAAARVLGDAISKEATDGTSHTGVVRPFNYGNSWYLIISETFRDVRMVCAPPSAIGKFGGDTDNWMWPRHTGDFSVFRIYASPENT
ncbi:MAG: S46 family peptidase, partial [Flavobacteriales bacterium]